MEPLHLLIVDDEPGMRRGVVRALDRLQLDLSDLDQAVTLTVTEAADGEAALARIESDRPDLVLLDHRLPGMSGLEVLARIHARGSDILAIMITAYASLEMAVNATKQGAYDFLAKPFTPQELKAVVRKAARHLILQREALRLAEEKRQVRFQFISVLAHELKAPIAAVEGYLKLMRDRVAGDALTTYDRMLDRSMLRLDGMRKLIFDLLDLTRIESGRKHRDLEPVDLRETAAQVIEGILAEAEQRNIAVRLHGPDALEMTADRGELEIILNNLFTNAVKYNRDNGRVDATLEADGERVTITVTDTGIGMSEKDLGRLFQEFSRIKNERTNDILGSGLGLSILKKLAQLNGGDVTVESVLDQGTTFIVTLARHQVPVPVEAAS